MMNRTNNSVAFSQRRNIYAAKTPDKKTASSNPENTAEKEIFTVRVTYNGDMGRVSGNGFSYSSVSVHKGDMRRVSGNEPNNISTSVHKGDTVTLTATPKTGYVFVKWLNVPAKAQDDSDNTVTFTVTSDLNIAAVFEENKSSDVDNPEDTDGDQDGYSNENPYKTRIQGTMDIMLKYWWVLALLVVGYWICEEGEP